jgi:hypothetical protein
MRRLAKKKKEKRQQEPIQSKKKALKRDQLGAKSSTRGPFRNKRKNHIRGRDPKG